MVLAPRCLAHTAIRYPDPHAEQRDDHSITQKAWRHLSSAASCRPPMDLDRSPIQTRGHPDHAHSDRRSTSWPTLPTAAGPAPAAHASRVGSTPPRATRRVARPMGEAASSSADGQPHDERAIQRPLCRVEPQHRESDGLVHVTSSSLIAFPRYCDPATTTNRSGSRHRVVRRRRSRPHTRRQPLVDPRTAPNDRTHRRPPKRFPTLSVIAIPLRRSASAARCRNTRRRQPATSASGARCRVNASVSTCLAIRFRHADADRVGPVRGSLLRRAGPTGSQPRTPDGHVRSGRRSVRRSR